MDIGKTYWQGDVNINVTMSTKRTSESKKVMRFLRVPANLYPIQYEFEDFDHLLEILGKNLEYDVLSSRFSDCVKAMDLAKTQKMKRAEYSDIQRIYKEQIEDLELYVFIKYNYVFDKDGKILNCDYQKFSLNYLTLLNYLKYNTNHFKPILDE